MTLDVFEKATQIFEEIMRAQDQGIRKELLDTERAVTPGDEMATGLAREEKCVIH